MSADQECRQVIFHGRVQGVGFRYTTHRIARRFSISGYVRNRADGTVELLACGASPEIQRFLDAVKSEFSGNIDSADDQLKAASVTEFDGFVIRR